MLCPQLHTQAHIMFVDPNASSSVCGHRGCFGAISTTTAAMVSCMRLFNRLQTQKETPVPPPHNIQLCQVGNNGANLTWDVVTSSGVEVVGYRVYFQDGKKKWKRFEIRKPLFFLPFKQEVLKGSISAIYTPLFKKGTVFEGGRSEPIAIQKTHRKKIPPPQNIQLQQVGDKQARLSWNEVTYPGVTVLGYLVVYKDGNSKWKRHRSTACEVVLPFENEMFVAQVAAIHTNFNGHRKKVLGERSKSISIQKSHQNKIPPPQIVQLQQFGDKQARLSWKEVTYPGVTVLGYLIFYKDGNLEWKSHISTACEVVLPFENEMFVAQVTAFHTAFNGQGGKILGERSNSISIPKVNRKYVPPPQNVQLQQVGDEWVRITWNKVTVPEVNVMSYRVYYADGSGNFIHYDTTKNQIEIRFISNTFSATVATWYKRTNVIEEQMLGRRASIVRIRKIHRQYVPPPQNVQLRQRGDNLAQLSWDEVTTPGVTVLSYLVSYYHGSGHWMNYETRQREVNITFVTNTIWASVAAYYKRINVLENKILGKRSITVSVHKAKLTHIPPPPQNVQLQQRGDNLARLSWNEVTAPGVTVLSYLVYYNNDRKHWKEEETTALEFNIEFVENYIWASVAAYYRLTSDPKNKILGNRSITVSVRKVKPPYVPPPQNVQLDQVEDKLVRLTWNEVTVPEVTVSGYLVRYYLDGKGWIEWETNELEYYIKFDANYLWASVGAQYKRTDVIEDIKLGNMSDPLLIQNSHLRCVK
ncbi:unnamed protein product [Rodentolepis nana]|uniref:Fibronectin type-III domain-containing protein n=1 Tax=Rodentolepis nana TaxID=102285 RepID=A0A158QI03_RODNA|nr:unnamed protein product [Rodentolepis nana]